MERKAGHGEVMLIGVISDTHGLIRMEAVAALGGCDLILHAGDVGDRAVLDALAASAPVVAVRGNCDVGALADSLPNAETVTVAGAVIHIIHDLKQLHIDPVEQGFNVVISGHSHRPLIRRDNDVLYVNPGYAGRRRFRLPVSVARLKTEHGHVDAEIVVLEV